MRCIRRAVFVKIKKITLLLTISIFLILLMIIFQHRPYFLNGAIKKYTKSSSAVVPGTFLKNYKPNNESYCYFRYNLPFNFEFVESEIEYSPELGDESGYRVLYNVVESKLNFSTTALVTYATHVTPDFVNYISEIIQNWDGPVSLAAFVPDFDADIMTNTLIDLCHCLPEMSKVSVHYVFPDGKKPVFKNNSKLHINCGTTSNLQTYRKQENLMYPINVCRNVARSGSITKYILVSDIELIPSNKLATKFSKIVHKVSKQLNYPSRVFVVPVFEVETGQVIPRTKQTLLKLLEEEKATYFHRHICSHCQKFPGLEQWLNQDPGNVVRPFAVVKREFPYHRWEPIYIGTKSEPFYNEVLSWEGKQDKMPQMLEMCLMGYKFVILDGAFLVHWPGIKRKSEMRVKNRWRMPYITKNARQYNSIISELANKYKKNPKCKMQ